MLLRIASIILTLFVSSAAFASSIQEEFRAKGSEVPLALTKLGYTHFGNLNLADFVTKIQSIPVRFDENVDKVNANGRISAHWSADGGIIVYPAWWSRFAQQQPVLALHEYLERLGFLDDQYWLSVSLWFLSLPETQTNLEEFQRGEIVKWIVRNANWRLPKGTKMAGSVVGVGGGGESGTLYMKMRGLLKSVRKLGTPLSDIDRQSELGWIAHNLESNAVVSWGDWGRK